jgi:GDP-D-mannose 3', 5'-epimerase
MNVLVAGAGGFIGGHLVGQLLDEGHDVLAVDIKPPEQWHQRHPAANWAGGDLRLGSACQHAVESLGGGVIYDLAASMGGIFFIETYPYECMDSVRISANLLRAAWKAGNINRFFYSSSACIYHQHYQTRPGVTALAEGHSHHEGGVAPEPGYGEEKWFSERLCQEVRDAHGLETRIARYHNIYGPHGDWSSGREKAPAAICRKVIEAKHTGSNEIEIWGDGTQTRSFCYIDDCVRATLELTFSDVREPVNIGSSELVTINQLVDLAEEFAGVKLDRRYNLDAPQGVRGRNSDNTRFRELFGWEPSTPLREGLRKTYDWIEQEWLKSA